MFCSALFRFVCCLLFVAAVSKQQANALHHKTVKRRSITSLLKTFELLLQRTDEYEQRHAHTSVFPHGLDCRAYDRDGILATLSETEAGERERETSSDVKQKQRQMCDRCC
jgi:hypothetical protein